jgi:hypothetical protein
MEQNGVYVTIAWIFMFMGVFFFILFLGNVIVGFIYPEEKFANGVEACTEENYLYGLKKHSNQ